MQQIVIGCGYGGFELSREAIELYLTSKGINFTCMDNGAGSVTFRTDDYCMFYPWEIERDDPVLVDIVRKLGVKASAPFAELKIVEIPDGVQWEICEEEDGIEYVAEAHRVWR